ncbi:hypothetical protein Tdes44962_MAKER00349 [Teratosphaeria destructans]|uniref:Uncharacterized protein n=1 Tax=Teratosphaeria destructans TaxID=418781 RepID=A0A9W7SSN5_9PEZI|nr:hypothetical protein Tdes44962_MAKER00349 [Teratosphaeria destructans]
MLDDHTQAPCFKTDRHEIKPESVRRDAGPEAADNNMVPAESVEAITARDDSSLAINSAEHIDRPEASLDEAPSAESEIQLTPSSVLIPSEQFDGILISSEQVDGESKDSAKRLSNLRSTSTKIASLRAAFEKEGTAADMVQSKRRLLSGDRGTDRIGEKEREYWREIGRLRDERDKEAEMKQLFQARCIELEDEIELLKQRIGTRDGKEQGDDRETKEGARDSKISSETGPPFSGVVGDVEAERKKQKAVEVPAAELHIPQTSTQVEILERQIADLKRTISTSTRMDPVRADTDLAQEMGVLHHELQNWTVNTYRRAKANSTPTELVAKLNRVAEAPHFDALRQVYATYDPSAKLAIYQSTAMTYIMDIFTANLLFGLGSSEQEWQSRVLQTAESLTHVLSPLAYNRWRSVTLDVIRHTNSLQEATEAVGMSMVESICAVLAAVSDVAASDSQRLSLNHIIRRAISLAHSFHVQRAQYEFTLPTAGSSFRGEIMDDIAAEDGDLGQCRPIRCATFLSVVKVGDEFGDSLHLRNVLVKAKALCTTPDGP